MMTNDQTSMMVTLLGVAEVIGGVGAVALAIAGAGWVGDTWRNVFGAGTAVGVVSELDRRLADKERDDAILAAWRERNAEGELHAALDELAPLRSAVEALPDGALITVGVDLARGPDKAVESWRDETGVIQFRDAKSFCPDTTAERARAALDAAKMGVPDQTALNRAWDRLSLSPAGLMCDPDEFVDPEPDVYAWHSVAEVLGR